MAQKIETTLIDDIDGKLADGTVRFGLDGVDYEIDLKAKHEQGLRDAFAPYILAGRKTSGAKAPKRAKASANGKAPASAVDAAAAEHRRKARQWARASGWVSAVTGKAVGTVGVLPPDLLPAYDEAMRAVV
jgi:hypothetical protein